MTERAIDERGLAYHYLFSGVKHLGGGQFYLFTIKDAHGNLLDGANSYRLTVPAEVPATQYWSAVPYDRATHTLFHDVPHVGRGSQTPGLKTNADGTVDLYTGPSAPSANETNWIPTKPGTMFEFCIRFYGPEKPLFDKTWQLSRTGFHGDVVCRFPSFLF